MIHDIVRANPDRSIGIIHIAWDSNCSTEHVYEVPPNVRWVYPVFLSMNDHVDDFKLASASSPRSARPGAGSCRTRSSRHSMP